MKIAIMNGHGKDKEGAIDKKGDDGVYKDEYYTLESVLVREIGLRLATRLMNKHDVLIIRPNDKYVTLSDRCKQANDYGADIVISLHANASANKKASGIETLYYKTPTFTSKKGKKLASEVQERLVHRTKAKDRGIKPRGDLYVLENASPPAILVEVGFITNPQEEAKLHSKKYQEQLIEAIYEGVNNYEKSE